MTLFVDGDLEGTVEAIAHKVTIGPNGTVHATVKAREVEVMGTLQGNVEATDRIEIRRNAKIVCDIRTARIHIEDGVYFKGSIDIIKSEPLRTPADSQPVVVATSPNQAGIAVVTSKPMAAVSIDSGGPPQAPKSDPGKHQQRLKYDTSQDAGIPLSANNNRKPDSYGHQG